MQENEPVSGAILRGVAFSSESTNEAIEFKSYKRVYNGNLESCTIVDVVLTSSGL